jgi:NADH:ubiquinone oxidoreductase subunit F (NADH-binding)
MLYELSKQIEGHTICALGDSCMASTGRSKSSNIESYGHTICTVGVVGKR